MFVPPRLVAGWLLVGAATCAIALPPAAFAQTPAGRMASPGTNINSLREGQVEWQTEAGASYRPSRPSRGLFSTGTGGAPWRGPGSRAYVPRHLRGVETGFAQAPGEFIESPIETHGDLHAIPEGATIIEGESFDITFGATPGDAPCCGEGGCGGSSCDSCGQCGQMECCCCCIPVPCLRSPTNLGVYGGVHGFKGPLNRGADSSFGFNEAVNWGGPLGMGGLGLQLGVRGAHSNFSGANALTLDSRNQLFLTGGLFRRVDCGLQFGAVMDYLRDDWDVSLDLAQVRGEISWMFVTQSEVGVRYAGPVVSDDSDAPPAVVGIDWEPVDTFALFFRQQLTSCGGEVQVFAGFSSESEGLIGAEVLAPLADHLALSAGFTYLIPEEGAGAVPVSGALQESWNVGVGVVLFPDAGFLNPANYYRPLFDVAHNGSFLVDADH